MCVRRFRFQPVCGDLQSQILKCYRQNAGKTLDCSSVASAYMQCVDHAKKVPRNPSWPHFFRIGDTFKPLLGLQNKVSTRG